MTPLINDPFAIPLIAKRVDTTNFETLIYLITVLATIKL